MVRIYFKKDFKTPTGQSFRGGYFYHDSSYARQGVAAGVALEELDWLQEQKLELEAKEAARLLLEQKEAEKAFLAAAMQAQQLQQIKEKEEAKAKRIAERMARKESKIIDSIPSPEIVAEEEIEEKEEILSENESIETENNSEPEEILGEEIE